MSTSSEMIAPASAGDSRLDAALDRRGENPVPGYSVNATEPREAHYVLSALQAGDALLQ